VKGSGDATMTDDLGGQGAHERLALVSWQRKLRVPLQCKRGGGSGGVERGGKAGEDAGEMRREEWERGRVSSRADAG